ncbi:MAG: hypothetical protein Q9173_003326 [Seirophora scorigena]
MKSKLPSKWPLGLGVLHQQWKANADKRLLAFQQPFLDELGPNLEVDILGSVGYTTLDPENIETALSTRFEGTSLAIFVYVLKKPLLKVRLDYCLGTRRGAMFPFLGEGIFTQDGGPWKHSRELLRRPFLKTHYQDLKGFQEPVQTLLNKLSASSGVIDLQPLFFQFTLATTTALIFGQPVESSDGDQRDSFASSFDHASWITTLRSRLTDFYWIYNPSHYRTACKNVQEFADGFVTRALSASSEGKKELGSDRYAFIDDLYAEYKDTSLVRDQLINVLLAGRDTTACLLSWTFFLLIRHPHVLSRLRSEIQNVIALRLYPPIPINVRFANKTTWLPRGGGPDGKSPVLVPKGLGLGLVPYYMHRRKDIYGADAMDYRPARWEGPELADIGWAYMPFHGGPRFCLGSVTEDFALMEASYSIVRILQEFPDIRLPPGYPVVPTGQEKQELTDLSIMGDPVSVAASLLTVLGAAATAGRTLDRLSSLRHAPDHLVALVNEKHINEISNKVSDLRVVLHNIRDAVEGRAETSQECGNVAYIVQRASLKMSELNRLIYGNLVKTPQLGMQQPGASRTKFLRHGGKIRSLKDDIQELKMSLLVAMGTLTLKTHGVNRGADASIPEPNVILRSWAQTFVDAMHRSLLTRSSSDVSRLKLDVCNVSLVSSQQNATQPLSNTGSPAAESLMGIVKSSPPSDSPLTVASRSLTSRIPGHVSIQRSADVKGDFESQQCIRAPIEHEFLSSMTSSFQDYVSRPAGNGKEYPHLRVEASVSSVSYQRDRLCLCQCHRVTTMATPTDWTKHLGRLFIGYTGLPTPAKRCDRKSCQHGHRQTRIRVAYLFPLWFALRMFAMTITKASSSFMWKLDFPAVTEGTSDMFVHTSLGNVEKIQGMLSMDAASFNVVESIALQFRQISAVAFLIEQGSDMYVQDCNNNLPKSFLVADNGLIRSRTPLDTFYENYFITTGERRMEGLLPLFEIYDVFDHWNLRQIHLIILGWSSVDLATYLSISMDEVDVFDSWGRTPLMWAAWRGDSQSVSILLEHGADPQATSSDGNSVLIYATYGGSLQCMKLILDTGADINQMSQSLLTPAMGGSQLGDNTAIAKVRLTRGAAIEASRQQKFTPLYVAALTNRLESLAFLLDCGASTNVSGWNCSTPLSMAISFSNHSMAEELITRGGDLNTASAFTVSYLRNAAVFVDEKMIRLFISARPAIDVDLKDLQGCTAEDRMKERLMSMGSTDPRKEGLAAAFEELVHLCAEEYERTQRAPEEIGSDEAPTPELEEDDFDETFHDALEDQQLPELPPTVYRTHVNDWAVKRNPGAFYQDSGQAFPEG